MCKHGHITGCLVIGDKPKWYKGEHLPGVTRPRKEWDIVSKVMCAPDGWYLYSHDDIFALQPFTEPMYHSGLLSKSGQGGLYVDRIKACITMYPYGMMYDNHTPMFIDMAKYKEAHGLCDWESRDYLSKSIYGNFIGGGEYLPDFKVRTRIDKIPDDRPFFSTSNQMARFINFPQLYQDASPFE